MHFVESSTEEYGCDSHTDIDMLLPKIGPLAALSAVAVATTVFNVPQSPPPISGVLDPSPVSFG